MPPDPVPIGRAAVDAALGGGLPRERTTALVGPPGTCKRALALAFLARGARDGERCRYVAATTDADAVADTAAALGVDPSFEITSLGGATADRRSSPVEEVRRLIEEGEAPARLVVDSLNAFGEERRPAVRELTAAARKVEATTLVLADGREATAVAGLHGLLRTRTEEGATTLSVERRDGADADRRPVELWTDAEGLHAGPTRRTPPNALSDAATRALGVPGLDDLCGGGLVTGDGVLLRHDGRADVGPLLGALLAGAIRDGYAVELVPTLDLRAERLDALLGAYDTSVEALLDADRLFVLDVTGAWETGRQNVFAGGHEPDELRANLRGIADRTDRPHLRIVDADAMVHTLGPAGARDLRYFQETTLLESEDLLVHVQNPAVVADEMAALYETAATQVLATELSAGGRQHLTLRKSPRGRVGATGLVEYVDEPPFVTVAAPGGD